MDIEQLKIEKICEVNIEINQSGYIEIVETHEKDEDGDTWWFRYRGDESLASAILKLIDRDKLEDGKFDRY